MKKFINKIKSFFTKASDVIKKPFVAIAHSKTVTWFLGTKFHKGWMKLWVDYAFWMHIPLSMGIIFLMEWMSRHSFVKAVGFVVDHTGPFLFNSYS